LIFLLFPKPSSGWERAIFGFTRGGLTIITPHWHGICCNFIETCFSQSGKAARPGRPKRVREPAFPTTLFKTDSIHPGGSHRAVAASIPEPSPVSTFAGKRAIGMSLYPESALPERISGTGKSRPPSAFPAVNAFS
jgi:hypothetical protein